ncbi:MAG: DMT family transporter, partial [Bacteroidales bacterium]|nr:DMT family transporter [Bacteroidales bacterium]
MAKFRADIILLVTAIIWGFAFVAQRMGMDHVGPFTFNGVRFLLGGISLLPLYYFNRKKYPVSSDKKGFIWGGIIAGIALFLGASLQQIGLQFTTAGKAGFITGLYVIFVPVLGLLNRQKTGVGIWIGAVIAIFGMYLLSVTDDFTIEKGDLLVLFSALFFAVHVLMIAYISPKYNALA